MRLLHFCSTLVTITTSIERLQSLLRTSIPREAQLHKDDFGKINPSDIPHSPSGRIPRWVTDEAEGRIEPREVWRSVPSGQLRAQKRHSRKRSFKTLLPFIVLFLILGTSIWSRNGGNFGTRLHFVSNNVPAPTSTNVGSSVVRTFNGPTPGAEEFPTPIGTPAPLAFTNNSYKFVQYQEDKSTPVAYDPCRPIHFVIRPDGEPIGGNQIIMDAVSRISQATGLQFIYDGATSEPPSAQRDLFQPARYGDHWVPVLFAWESITENADFAASVEGQSGSASVSLGSGPRVFVTGMVELNSEGLARLLLNPDGNRLVHAVVLHELGHLVGLAHVADQSQLMFPESSYAVTDLQSGDLTGAAILGRGLCAPDL